MKKYNQKTKYKKLANTLQFKNIPKKEEQFSLHFMEQNKCLLLEKNEKNIFVACCKKLSFFTELLIENSFSKPTEYFLISTEIFNKLINEILGFDFSEQKKFLAKNDIDKIEKNSPTVNLLNSIFQDALKQNASDIHFESNESEGIVRFRIAGELYFHRKFNIQTFNSLSTRIKILSDLNILEKRLPQDGRIQISINKTNIDLRVSIVPASKGESIVLRILQKNKKLIKLDNLGFSQNQLKILKNLISLPNGLILISGPTGSGKTTTLNSILNTLADGKTKIISIEDPVEYSIKNVNQIQINEDIGLNFETILKRILRQDPNIIMLGEIRDKITAELCIRAALTGHLVFSTVHTNDAVSIINRLLNFNIEPFMIATVLKGIISQRLVKSKNSKSTRTIISESFYIDKKIQSLILENCQEEKIIEYLKKKNFEFISDDAKNKIKNEICSYSDVIKEIKLED